MESALQHNGARASKLASLLSEAKAQGQKQIEHIAARQDATDWRIIAPPGDSVTEGYLNANQNLVGLVSAIALHRSQSQVASERGQLYPFVMGAQKTNSLRYMAEWLAEQHVAHLLLSQKLKTSEAMGLIAEHSSTWHLLNAVKLLNAWAGNVSASYDIAVKVTASAKHVNNDAFVRACRNLAHAAFILACPELPHPPSFTMTDRLWDVLVRKSQSDSELSSLFPAVVDIEILKLERTTPKYVSTEHIWAKLIAVSELIGVASAATFDI